MTLRTLVNVLPSRALVYGLLIAALLTLAALLFGVPLAVATGVTAAAIASLLLACALDAWRSAVQWANAPLEVQRRLPAALAIGVPTLIELQLANAGPQAWQVAVYDAIDPTLLADGLPLAARVAAGTVHTCSYRVAPTQRGELHFAPAHLRLRSRWGLLQLLRHAGPEQSIRAYPNFAAVARYAWLAGTQRLAEIGIKSFTRRGEGTDFRELADYTAGDAIRHIDWKATQKFGRPIVRRFQDERDQRVVFLLDCGRRMRAHENADVAASAIDDQQAGEAARLSHFDQALNALTLLAYVALAQGDAVGALTFGHARAGDTRLFAPRKGTGSFNALMAALYDLQPTPAYSDYAVAARDAMLRLPKRALVVVLTNFRDEDAAELAPALRLLRSRHLVLLASLREPVLRELIEQPLAGQAGSAAVEVATAHLMLQARTTAFQQLAGRDALLIDVEPQALPIALVNRYHAVKRAGLL
jgi:uncharacterized protein (DUF58 family)